MPDLKTIVQRMIDANESEEDINATIERFKELNPPKPQAQPIAPHEPDTFASGVLRSLGTGEAFKAGAEGGLGWLKGAITDLPETLWGAAKDLGTSLSDPIQTIKDAPGAFRHGIPAMGKQMWDTTTNAGADPEAFGRMMGQLTGQPLVTEGIIKGVPQLRAPVGKLLDKAGKYGAEKQPLTGMIPSMFGMRTARNAEAAVGRGMQRVGERMRLKATGVESADKLARTGPSKANKGLRSFDLKAESGTPSRNRSLPYEPRQKPVGVGEDYGNIDLEVPVNDPRIWVKRPEGVPSRSRSLPYESSGAIDLEAPVGDPNIGVAPAPEGIPSRYRDVPYEPQPTIEPPSGANLVKDKVPTVEEQMATILEQISDEGTRQPGTELPPPPFSHGEGPPTTQPVINYPSSGEIKVLLRELAKKEAKEAAEAAKKAAAKKEAAPESPRPSTVTPEQVQEVFPGLKNERPTGVPEGVDPVTGEIIELLRAKKNKSKGLWKPVMDFLKGEKGEIDYDKFFRREPDDIGNMPDEAIDLNQEVGRIEPQKTIRPEDWGDWGGDEVGLPTLIPDESGSHVAESPVAARKQLAGINPLRPDVPAGQVTNKRMFELSEQRAAENQVHPGREFADRVLSHEFDEDMLFTPEELNRVDIPQRTFEAQNKFDQRIVPERENILEGARERFGRDEPDFSNDMHEKKTRFWGGGIEGMDEFGPHLQKMQDRFHQLRDQFESLTDAEAKELNMLTHELDAAGARRPRQFQGGTDSTGFGDPNTNRKWKSTGLGKRMLAGEKSTSNDMKRRPPQSGGPGYAQINPNETQAKTPGYLSNKAYELAGKIRELADSDSPDSAYSELSGKDPLKAGDTYKDRASRLVDSLEKTVRGDENSKAPEAAQPSQPRLIREDGTKVKPLGPKGEAFKVSDPSGKHLGDIDITEAQISEIQNHPELGDIPREEIIKSIYDAKLEDILEQHGVQENAKSRIKIEPKDNRLKRTEVTELAGEPTFSTTKKAEKIAADPEKAFGPDGDTRPILMEMSILERNQATDLKYKPLLPKEMQYALDIEKGETFKGRLVDLLEASKPLDDPDLVSRSATQDEFIKSTKQEHPPLRANKVKFSEKASKFAKGFLKDN